MKSSTDLHAQGISLFGAGRYMEARDALRQALSEADSSELWNDWASAQFMLGQTDEAEAGFRLALEMDSSNAEASANLAALLTAQGKSAQTACDPCHDTRILEELRARCPADGNERSYFETHRRRYLETLRMLPDAQPGQRLLELGAAFHHLTPMLLSFKRYCEVRCNDIWQGETTITRTLAGHASTEPFSVVVDNFDVQSAPWPYEDSSFDVVLFCEMLEHLHTDPVGVLAEINRVLRTGGLLLLTTPNLASCHSVEYALRGNSPYVYGKFEPGGASTDRHNREYTANEIKHLADAAGFACEQLATRDSWWQPDRKVLRLLAARGEPIALRGDNIFLLARKVSGVRERYPEEFYLRLGTQAERRDTQSAQTEFASSELSPAIPPQKILVIHELVPHFDQSGSDLRLLDVLKELRAQSHAVTLLARDASNAERYQPELERLGIRVLAGDPDRMKHIGLDAATSWSFEQLLRREMFDVAILFHWFWSGVSIPEHYLPEIRRCSPSTRVAVLTDDRHGERERRSATLSGLFSDWERAADFEAREFAAYGSSDLLLYITEADHRHFRIALPELPTELLPLVAPSTARVLESTSKSSRAGALFLGNFANPANRDALTWFTREVWPIVRKRLPELDLRVAGNLCPQEFASTRDRIEILGKVANLSEIFGAALVFVSPIRIGTGINTKNLQAMAHGLPIVTTSVGAEGLQLVDGRHALLADTPLTFADAIHRLCAQPGLWNSLSAQSREYVSSNFSCQHLSDRIKAILKRLATLTPQKTSRLELGSYRLVEQKPTVLAAVPPRYRVVLRTLEYWRLGSEFLSSGEPLKSLEQFRHIFAAVRGPLPDTLFHHALLSDMAQAYRAAKDFAGALRCERERTQLVSLHTGDASKRRPLRSRPLKKDGTPLLSVVLPTCNRRNTLDLCLSALAFQTLPADQWEVVVVDDGSSDGTHETLAQRFPFALNVISQPNRGAGAARRAGVAAARGEFVVLFNDDTIAASTLLEEHLRLQCLHAAGKVAVLGQFFPSSECGRRALSFWINHSPFLFPQNTLKPGQLCHQAFFVTCNLSVRRQALLDAGNFDAAFRVAEDTEIGARLAQQGYRVRYEPTAAATHEHSSFSSADLLRRAAAYGVATWNLLRKHPHLLADGCGPFGRLADEDLQKIRSIRMQKAEAAESGLLALQALDNFDIAPLWLQNADGLRPVDALIEKVGAIAPVVYWHHLFGAFLEAAASSTTNPALAAPTPEFAAP